MGWWLGVSKYDLQNYVCLFIIENVNFFFIFHRDCHFNRRFPTSYLIAVWNSCCEGCHITSLKNWKPFSLRVQNNVWRCLLHISVACPLNVVIFFFMKLTRRQWMKNQKYFNFDSKFMRNHKKYTASTNCL